MSIRMMSLVFSSYPNGGGEMLLALALADHAHDNGTSIRPGIRSLAIKTRQSERTVQYQLRKMEEAGWLILVNSGNGGRNQRREYRINPSWIKGANSAPIEYETVQYDDVKGANDDNKGCNLQQERVQQLLHPHRTIIEPSVEPSERGARAQIGEHPITDDWKPDPETLRMVCLKKSVPTDRITSDLITDFVLYWSTKSACHHEQVWISKLCDLAKMQRTRPAPVVSPEKPDPNKPSALALKIHRELHPEQYANEAQS